MPAGVGKSQQVQVLRSTPPLYQCTFYRWYFDQILVRATALLRDLNPIAKHRLAGESTSPVTVRADLLTY